MFDAILTRRRSSMLDDVVMGTVLCGAIVFQVAGVGWALSGTSHSVASNEAAPEAVASVQGMVVASVPLAPGGQGLVPCHRATGHWGADSSVPATAR